MPSDASQPPPVRRPYLRADARRRQLLGAAARLAGKEGLARLSMVGVAQEAGVSRQLLYEHFPDLPALTAALLIDRFGELDAAIEGRIAREPGDPVEAAVGVTAMLLALPGDDRRILRALHAYASMPEHELRELGIRLRARTIDRWGSLLQVGEDAGARAMVWALASAVLGLGELVDAGAVSTDQALEQITILIRAAIPPVIRPAG